MRVNYIIQLLFCLSVTSSVALGDGDCKKMDMLGVAQSKRADLYSHYGPFTKAFIQNFNPPRDPKDPTQGYYWGAVAAALPTDHEPNYTYDWTRDGGIAATMYAHYVRMGVNMSPEDREQAYTFFIKYLEGRRKFIETEYWSGKPTRNGDSDVYPNMGEAKTNLDFTKISKPWMSPQIDGSAYSAKAILFISRLIWEQWGKLFGKDSPRQTFLARGDLYNTREDLMNNRSIVKHYLEYLLHNWHKPSYEAWEEAFGYHFATFGAIQAVLAEEGPAFARLMGDPDGAKAYEMVTDPRNTSGPKRSISELIDERLEEFWDPRLKVIVPSKGDKPGSQYIYAVNDTINKENGIDIQVPIALSHMKSKVWTPINSKVLSTIYRGEIFFKDYFAGNKNEKVVIWGRYKGDAYSGDHRDKRNPNDSQERERGRGWFLTYYLAAHAFRAAEELYKAQAVEIDELNVDYYNYVLKQTGHSEQVSVGMKLRGTDPLFSVLVVSQIERGHLIDNRLKQFVGPKGEMSEQIYLDRENITGVEHQRSAESLTWSHAAYIRMIVAYEDLVTTLKGETPSRDKVFFPRNGNEENGMSH